MRRSRFCSWSGLQHEAVARGAGQQLVEFGIGFEEVEPRAPGRVVDQRLLALPAGGQPFRIHAEAGLGQRRAFQHHAKAIALSFAVGVQRLGKFPALAAPAAHDAVLQHPHQHLAHQRGTLSIGLLEFALGHLRTEAPRSAIAQQLVVEGAGLVLRQRTLHARQFGLRGLQRVAAMRRMVQEAALVQEPQRRAHRRARDA